MTLREQYERETGLGAISAEYVAWLEAQNAALLAVIKQAGELAGRWGRQYGREYQCAAELRSVLESKQ